MDNSKHSLGLLIDIVSNENDGFRKNDFSFDDFADDLDFINDNLDEDTESNAHEAEGLASNTTEEISSQSGPLSAINNTEEREHETESIASSNTDKPSRRGPLSADKEEHDIGSVGSNNTDETSRNEHLSASNKTQKTNTPIMVAEKDESLSDGVSEDETVELPPASPTAEAEEVEDTEEDISEHNRKKSVSFDLPIIEEYSDDFDTGDEEDETSGNSKVNSDSENSAGARNDEVSVSEEKSEKDVVNICTNCNCRMTTLRLRDLPELDSLFVNKQGKRSKKCKHDSKSNFEMKTRTKAAKDQGNANSSSDGKIRNSKAERKKQLSSSGKTDSNKSGGDGERMRTKIEPVDDTWGENSNTSLLQWLKNKNKEVKQKRRQERKIKKEEKRTKRLEEMEKLCKKDLSDRLVDDWMQSKKKEWKLSRKISGNKKVSPLGCESGEMASGDSRPQGYTVLNTFKKSPSRKTSREVQREVEKFDASGPKRVQKKKTLFDKQRVKSSHQSGEADKSNSSDKGVQLKARKSYDEWLNEKRSSKNEKTVLKNSWVKSEDNKLLKNERIRRNKEKDNSKIKVDSSIKKTESKVSHKSTKIKEKSKGYQWRSEELKSAQRPDPQGSDNPDSHLSSISPDSEVTDNCESQSVQSADSKVIEIETKGKSRLLEYLTEDNRAWMPEKSTEKPTEATKSCRPKTAHTRIHEE